MQARDLRDLLIGRQSAFPFSMACAASMLASNHPYATPTASHPPAARHDRWPPLSPSVGLPLLRAPATLASQTTAPHRHAMTGARPPCMLPPSPPQPPRHQAPRQQPKSRQDRQSVVATLSAKSKLRQDRQSAHSISARKTQSRQYRQYIKPARFPQAKLETPARSAMRGRAHSAQSHLRQYRQYRQYLSHCHARHTSAARQKRQRLQTRASHPRAWVAATRGPGATILVSDPDYGGM